MKRMMILVGVLIGAMLVVAGCTTASQSKGEKPGAVIFKSSSCGCCGLYADYMEKKGFDVEVRTVEDVTSVKTREGIPAAMQSCHTTMIGDYFVEGHVPVEAIEKLLAEQPDIAGIALPDMPSASPGMPGSKQGPFVIQAVHHDGSPSEFMRI